MRQTSRPKPRSVGDLVGALAERAALLSTSAAHLRKASQLLAHSEASSPKGTLRDLLDGHGYRANAFAHLTGVERALIDDVRFVRQAAKVLMLERLPGRPRVMAAWEVRVALHGRAIGLSWGRVLLELNKERKTSNRLKLSTLRSAVRRSAVQIPRLNKR